MKQYVDTRPVNRNTRKIQDVLFRYRYIILFVIIIVAFVLRYHPINDDIATDEAKYMLGIDYPGAGIISDIFYQVQLMAGFHENLIRLITILCSLAVLIVFYNIGRLFDWRLGLLMSTVGAILPTNIIMSRTGYLDMYMLLSMSIAVYCFLKISIFWNDPSGQNLSDQNISSQRGNLEKQDLHTGSYLIYLVYLIILFLSVLLTALIKPQGIIIIVPFILYGLWHNRKGLKTFFSSPEYYAIALPIIPFILDYLANPQRLADFLNFFNKQQVLTHSIFYKLSIPLSYIYSSEGLFWIFAVIGLVFAIIIISRRDAKRIEAGKDVRKYVKDVSKDAKKSDTKVARKDKKADNYFSNTDDAMLFLVIFFIFLIIAYFTILLPTYYYLVYMNLSLAFFISFIFLFFIDSRLKNKSLRIFSTILCCALALILFLCALLSASPYFGMQNPMYHSFADKNYLLFQDNKDVINDFFSGQDMAVIGGDFGHQYEYYIQKPVFRSCVLENDPLAQRFDITRAIVTNLPYSTCTNATDSITNAANDWQLVNTVEDHGESISFYIRKS